MSNSAAQHDDDFKSRIAVLEAELASVRRAHDLQAEMRERAEHEREQYRKLYTLVLYELERLKRQLFGKKSETVDPTQVQLVFGPVFDALARAEQGDQGAQDDVRTELEKLKAAAEKAKAEAEANKPKRDNERKGHGRRNFDKEQAPVVEIVLEPPERKLPGGELLEKIEDEVSEHFEYRPASIVRVRVMRPKYRRPTPAPGQSPILRLLGRPRRLETNAPAPCASKLRSRRRSWRTLTPSDSAAARCVSVPSTSRVITVARSNSFVLIVHSSSTSAS